MKRIIFRKNITFNAVRLLRWAALVLGLLFSAAPGFAQGPGQAKLKVMTRNLYIGADIFRVVEAATNPAADPLAVPMAVAQVFQTIDYTNFTERADAIADEIEHLQPHLVGLQEVSTILDQEPGDFLSGNPTPAENVVFDYLAILMDDLKTRKLKYDVATLVSNADVELPMLVGLDDAGLPVFNDVRLIDHDVILVRRGVAYGNAEALNYAVNVSLPLGGTQIEFTRGYAALDAEVGGRSFRFVNTHLEVGGGVDYLFSAVQAAQMGELLTRLAGIADPVILVGDLNSAAEDVAVETSLHGWIVPPYTQAIAAGYLDIAELSRKSVGPTCCFNETLDDPDAALYERIDHILVAPRGGVEIQKAKVKTVGDEIDDMTASGLWPSDHAGVAGAIKFKSCGAQGGTRPFGCHWE